MNVKKHLSIRMDGELHDKFQYVAAYEGRSMSGQVLYLLRKCVQEHEKEYGKITKEDLEDPSVPPTGRAPLLFPRSLSFFSAFTCVFFRCVLS